MFHWQMDSLLERALAHARAGELASRVGGGGLFNPQNKPP